MRFHSNATTTAPSRRLPRLAIVGFACVVVHAGAAAGCECGSTVLVDGGTVRDVPSIDAPLDVSIGLDAPRDGGLSPDTGADAGLLDAGVDTGTDAPTDAGSDAGLEPLELFATIGDWFVRIDPATGDATGIGLTGVGPVAKLTYDERADVIYGVVDYLATPRLVTVDPCTGAATVRATLTLPGGSVYIVGAMDYDAASGTMFATISRDGPYPGDTTEEHLARLDTTTGVVTSVGDLLETATRLDGDALMLSPGLRLLIDSDPVVGAPTHSLWRLDLTTGAATGRLTAPGAIYTAELHGGVLYGSTGSGPLAGHLVVVDPATGLLTDVGPTHTTGEFGGSLWTLTEARASCP